MQDFTRIGGAITSSPLNENFRKLANNIDMTNTNILWDSEQGIVNTISDMSAISSPQNGQACYVISSGELYRYYTRDNQWHKIMDIGNTFRQGFLNSGAVVLEDDIKYVSDNTLKFPNMLVYFKNAEGDGRYLKGMYLIEESERSFTLTNPGSYSVYVNKYSEFNVSTGLPSQDDPNNIFLGTFLIGSNGKIIKDFIYTLPDMAYTADRGHFIMNGGEAKGLNLLPGSTNDRQVNRADGYYYDEGINYPTGQTEDYPYDTDNGSNFDLKTYDAQSPVSKIYYIAPVNSLTNKIIEETGLIFDKYWGPNNKLEDVPSGQFTIQEHLVTPTGQNIVLYGNKLYNSMADAISNINSSFGLDIDFPYVQATRIVIGNTDVHSTEESVGACKFFTIGRLAQVGTISPEFADNIFKIYSGDITDNTPSMVRFSLEALQSEDYNSLYNLKVLPFNVTRKLLFDNNQYITDDIIKHDAKESVGLRTIDSVDGYYIADQQDVENLVNRVNAIESEIWHVFKEGEEIEAYEQSIRYRLYHHELRLSTNESNIKKNQDNILWLENNKVHKGTTINGYTLGDQTTDGKEEKKAIVLNTDDIDETGNATNKWYTEERVNNNINVSASVTHKNTISATDDAEGHTRVNPHNISTDDLTILQNTSRIFVSPEEERRIRSDRLPENTIQALQDLDDKNMDYLHISYQEGSSSDPGASIIDLGNAKKLRFYQSGVKLDMDSDGETAIIECIGQVDDSIVMYRNRYATLEAEYPDLYGGYVDKAVNAEYAYYVGNIDQATASQYYGTNEEGTIGIYDLPKYVASADASSYASIDQVTFEPIDGSVQEKHLETTLKEKINNNFHAIFDGGVLSSAEINTFDFGNNLHVTVSGHKATINAVAAGEPAENKFTSLEDVDVTYTNNEGKMVIVNSEGTGLTLAKTPSTQEYMLRSIYVEPTDVSKVKKAVNADKATLADSATNALAVNNKSVDNTSTTEGLWTASKIISNTSSQIASEGVNTYSGTTVPSNTLGKNGDIYILIES